MNKKINLIIFGMSAYENWLAGVQNRNFQILQELIKQKDVEKIIYVDYLPWTFKQALKIALSILRSRLKLKKIHYPSLTSRLTKPLEKLLVYSNFGYFFNKSKFYQQLKQLILKELGNNYLLWSYYPVNLDYLTELQPKLTVFDLVDNWAEHPSYQTIKNQLVQNYKQLVQKADLVFTVAEHFKNWLGDEANIYWLPNGVRTEKFNEPSRLINKDLSIIPEPRIGYTGTIQNRIDFPLLEYVLQQHPQKSFVFIGPTWPIYFSWLWPNSPRQLIIKLRKKYKNFYWLGRKSYQEIPTYLHHCKIGIIPHTTGSYTRYTDSMKIYEYLAAGLPVVTTPAPNLEQFAGLIQVATTPEEFSHAIDEALLENNPPANSRRQAVAQANDWSRRAETMLQLIQKKLAER